MKKPVVVRDEPSAAEGSEAVVRLTERLLTETRDELRRADAKAAQWLSMLGAGAIGVVALWNSAPAPPWPVGSSAFWPALTGCGFAVPAAISFALALVPRIGGAPDQREVAYFGHVYRIGDPVLLRRHIEEAAGDSLHGMVGQLHHLSRLAVLKYRCIRIGTGSGTAAAILLLTASL
jgi:hypothetical protein